MAPRQGEDLRILVQTFVRRFGLLDQSRTPCGKPISISSAHALFEVARTPGLDQNELAARLGLSKSGVSRLAAGLERAGFVRRPKSQADGRARLLELTTRGARAAREINRASMAFFDEIIAGLPPNGVGVVFEGLSALIKAIPAVGPHGRATAKRHAVPPSPAELGRVREEQRR